MFSKALKGLTNKRATLRIFLVGLIWLCSCAIFDVRDAEQPTGGAGEVQIQRTPQAVISNIKNSLFSSDPINYEETLSDEFIFVPDASDIAEFDIYYPGVLTQWDKRIEVGVVKSLLDRLIDQPVGLEYDEQSIQILEETDSTYVLKANYQIVVCWLGQPWDKYHGTCVLSIHLETDGLWRVRRWEDYRRSVPPEKSKGTWGILKGTIRATM